MRVYLSKKALLILSVVSICGGGALLFDSRLSFAQTVKHEPSLKLLGEWTQKPDDDPLKETNPFVSQGTLIYDYRRSRNKTLIVSRNYDNGTIRFHSFLVESPNSDIYNSIYDVKQSAQGQISFRYGFSDGESSEYQIFILNPFTKSISRVAPEQGLLAYKSYFWSPDGKYLAFLSGGSLNGSSRTEQAPKLCVYDVTKQDSRVIANSSYLMGGFMWSGNHDLYYVSSNFKANTPPARATERLKSEKPFLFHFSPESGKSTLLFEGYRRPAISDDSNKLAFWQYNSVSSTPQRKVEEKTLYVSNLNGTQKQHLNTEGGFYPYLFWSSNKKSLIGAGTISTGPKAQMTFIWWNAENGQKRGAATLEVSDSDSLTGIGSEPIDQPETFPRFEILGRFQDTFIVSSVQLTGMEGAQLKTRTLLQSIDVFSGKVTQLGTAQTYDYGVRFHWTPTNNEKASEN